MVKTKNNIERGIEIVLSKEELRNIPTEVIQDLKNYQFNSAVDRMAHAHSRHIDSHMVDAMRYAMLPQPEPKPRTRLQRWLDKIVAVYYRIGRSVTYWMMDKFKIDNY